MLDRLFLGIAIAGLSTVAFAAQRPPPAPPPYNWNGCYIGANAGGKWWANTSGTVNIAPGIDAVTSITSFNFNANGVSNWEVDSESTVALMTGLFEALKNDSHLSHAEALRLSMLRMIDHPSKSEWVEPRYWAPFIVVGEPQKH
jgi:hypothetical protein